MTADPRKTAQRLLAEEGQRRPVPSIPPIGELADLARDYLRLLDAVAIPRETLGDPVDGVLYVTTSPEDAVGRQAARRPERGASGRVPPTALPSMGPVVEAGPDRTTRRPR